MSSPQRSAADTTGAQSTYVYIGTNTTTTTISRGIYVFRLDADGTSTPVELAAEVKNPTFLAVAPDHKHLYAVNEISDFQGKKMGGVSAFSSNPTSASLTLINQQPSGGVGPCHLCISPDGKYVATANYGNGSIALLPVKPDGSLTSPTSVIQHHGSSINPQRQSGPHAHSVNFDPAGHYLLAADLGLDQIKSYRLNATTDTLEPNDPPFATVAPGSGPRHLAFHPNGKFAYVASEMGNTVTAFKYDAQKGALTEIQTTSTIPAGYSEKTFAAEVRVHPSGRFVYVSNRGHDSIAIFSVDPKTGQLSAAGYEPVGGKWPRHFNIDPSGRWLIAANQNSNNVVLFRIDTETGQLQQTGDIHDAGKPVCILFVPVP